MTKLLIDELPLILLPNLAKDIGLNEAIIVQQIHYWIEHEGPDGRKYGKVVDGRRWIRNSVDGWQKTNFPFFSASQIYRALSSLEKGNLIQSRKDLNDASYDRTKWYTINYPIFHQREMELSKMQNGILASEDTIPDTTKKTPDTEPAKPNKPKTEYVKRSEMMEKVFANARGCDVPDWENGNPRGLMKTWRHPLNQILNSCDGNIENACFAIRETVRKMKEEHLTFSTPIQILKTADSVIIDLKNKVEEKTYVIT